MTNEVTTPDEYIDSLPEERRSPIRLLRETILANLEKGFEERILYGMISFVIPHSIYPKGYHCNPSDPVPFISFASQKNYIALYHMGIYAFPDLLKWFSEEYQFVMNRKPDMGKSCIRFKNIDTIPYELIGKLCKKLTPEEFLKFYQEARNK